MYNLLDFIKKHFPGAILTSEWNRANGQWELRAAYADGSTIACATNKGPAHCAIEMKRRLSEQLTKGEGI